MNIKNDTSPLLGTFNYEWNLKDTVFTKDKGTVFSCFSCGGGSTMGYKLAGFDVIGCNEIDPKMMEAYKENHNPKYSYLESITTFKDRDDLPEELYNLDILDGSPPCSSFSVAGNRSKDWGKEKKFREGQEKQVLDTLFFDFIDLGKKLQPKVIIAENVKGMLVGDAIKYVQKIYVELEAAGYYCQHWLLNASDMGIPQRRERVFFVCLRKDLAGDFLVNKGLFEQAPSINMHFAEKEINIKDFAEFETKKETINYCPDRFGDVILNINRAAPTITSGVRFWKDENSTLKSHCYNLIGSFPKDYKFNSDNVYMIGMSVPPLMAAKIASRVSDQWLDKITDAL